MAQAKKPTDIEIISKLSIKTMGTDPKECLAQKKSMPLARFWGIANTVKYVPNRTTGDTSIALVGTFRGLNLATGQMFESGVCYLPGGIQDQINGPLIKAKDSGSDTENIRFALEVSSFPSTNPGGYSYSAKALLKPEGSNPLDEIENFVDGLLALSAPVKK